MPPLLFLLHHARVLFLIWVMDQQQEERGRKGGKRHRSLTADTTGRIKLLWCEVWNNKKKELRHLHTACPFPMACWYGALPCLLPFFLPPCPSSFLRGKVQRNHSLLVLSCHASSITLPHPSWGGVREGEEEGHLVHRLSFPSPCLLYLLLFLSTDCFFL